MYPVIRARNRKETILQEEKILNSGERIEFFTFPGLSEIDCVKHLFTTRIGGISEGEFATLNFSVIRGDAPEKVLENYKRIAEVFETDVTAFVATDQTHTTNIRVVKKEDAGKGVVVPKDYQDIDGLITDEPGLVLACFTADCVPIYFVDPVKKVIGVAHSGWRGTVDGIGTRMVEIMNSRFGCDVQNVLTAIGPSICQECYEISEEVAKRFREGFWSQENIEKICVEAYEEKIHPTGKMLEDGKETGKYQLDLWLANYIVLREAGIPMKNISITDVCTCCNDAYLFSHRASGGRRGNLAAFLMLKK